MVLTGNLVDQIHRLLVDNRELPVEIADRITGLSLSGAIDFVILSERIGTAVRRDGGILNSIKVRFPVLEHFALGFSRKLGGKDQGWIELSVDNGTAGLRDISGINDEGTAWWQFLNRFAYLAGQNSFDKGFAAALVIWVSHT